MAQGIFRGIRTRKKGPRDFIIAGKVYRLGVMPRRPPAVLGATLLEI